MGKIEVEGVRRHVRAFGHETEIAERAGLDDGGEVLALHPLDFAAGRSIHQIEQPGKAVAEIEAAPAAMTDIEDPAHLRIELGGIGELRIRPGKRVAGGRVEAAFGHRFVPSKVRSPIAAPSAEQGGEGRKGDEAVRPWEPKPGDQSVSNAFWKRPAWDFSALARVSNQSAISSKPSERAVLAMPGYMSVYSWVSPAIEALRLASVAPIGSPVAGSPTSSRYSRWPWAWPVSPSAVERNTAATSLWPSTSAFCAK